MRASFLILFFSLAFTSSNFAIDYYLDAINGNDGASGSSAENAWQSLAKINAIVLQPGDVIRFKRGTVFAGQFKPQGSGSVKDVITVTAYGDGPKPHIAAGGDYQAAVLLENLSYWVVDGLEISNRGAEPVAKRRGVHLRAVNSGVIRSITLRNLTVRDVNGVISKDKGGGSGIYWEVSSLKKKSRFDNLLIENCHLLRCDRDGIKGWMQPWDDLSFLSTNVVIRGNTLEDIGGDGIVPIGTDHALVEYNRIYDARKRFDPTIKEVSQYAGPSVGIWPWSSTNTLIRFNEVWGYRGTFDGQAFDSDFNCSGTTFEYNLSAHNAGGFFLVCNWAKHQDSGQSIGNSNTTIRHNISFDDYLRGFVVNGPVSNVRIDSNIIYNTIEPEFQLLVDTPWGGYADSVTVENNLFYTTGKAQIYQATWDGKGMGTWKYQKPLNVETVQFRNNAYLNAPQYNEVGKRHLSAGKNLRDLMQILEATPSSGIDFKPMIEFLRDSKKWEIIKSSLR
jgi:hypothetical protein